MLVKSFMNRSLKTRMMLLYTLFAVVLVGGISYYAYTFTKTFMRQYKSCTPQVKRDVIFAGISN